MWINQIVEQVRESGPLVRICVIETKGSTPRERGAAMIVDRDHTSGTIGGGALEYDAIAYARIMLEAASQSPWIRQTKEYSLGPSLGQCCGGFVKLLFEKFETPEITEIAQYSGVDNQYAVRSLHSGEPLTIGENTKTEEAGVFVEPLTRETISVYLYGAGHVAREVVRIFSSMDVSIVWIDTDQNRFPDKLPANVSRMIAASPAALVKYAPVDAFHLVMTYSHPLDLEICHAVLKKGAFSYLGLIGSETKRNRFENRLKALGITMREIARLVCPIGIDGLTSKEPSVIGISVAAQILQLAEQK